MEVKDLPEAAIKAFEQEGIDIASVICTDKAGKMHMMKNTDVNSRTDIKFPIKTTQIEDMTAISMVRYKGSDCCLHVIDGNLVLICW